MDYKHTRILKYNKFNTSDLNILLVNRAEILRFFFSFLFFSLNSTKHLQSCFQAMFNSSVFISALSEVLMQTYYVTRRS